MKTRKYLFPFVVLLLVTLVFSPLQAMAAVGETVPQNVKEASVLEQAGSEISPWMYCANEGGQCYFSGTQEVRYGANGQFYYKTLTNGTPCTNAVFGDPIHGTVKQCYYRSASCSIDLVNNTHTCTGVTPVAFVAAPASGKTVMRLNLSTYKKAYFEVTYNAAPTGWTVNIGDSATNNGYAGDAGTQSNDAELHVTDQSFLVYANDYGGSKLLTNRANFVQSGSTVSFVVSNNRVDYTSTAGQAGTQTSPYLYALAGQADAEGPVNYDIYAAFNRVIAGGSRVGSGVSRVVISLTP